MVFFVTLRKTAGIVLRKLPIYFLCSVGVAAPTVLIEWANPEFAGNRRYLASHGAADLAIALNIVLAILTIPFHAIATWYTACWCRTHPASLRESISSLLRNGITLTLLSTLQTLVWCLVPLWKELPLLVPLNFCLILALIHVLFRCSIAFAIALMENRSTVEALVLSWRRMRRHWLIAGAIASMYGLTLVVYSLFLSFQYGQMHPYPTRWWYGYAAIQVAWTVALTYLYLHVSREAAIPSPDTSSSPPLDALIQDEQRGEPTPLAAPHGVAPSK